MLKITNLYPQYNNSRDRRQQNIPVTVERRSGVDRRSSDRLQLDSRLTQDIFAVKNQVAKLGSIAPVFFKGNNLNADEFTHEYDNQKDIDSEKSLRDKASIPFKIGVLGSAAALGVLISFLTPMQACLAIGATISLGIAIMKVSNK